jgi:hypothetical protein
MKRRPPKKSDQKNVEKAFKILKETIQSHPEIEPTLWASAVWSILVEGYVNSGASYELFCDEWDRIKEHYKGFFE